MSKQITSSEKRLVYTFVLGALAFLIVFESIFLIGRFYIERDAHEKYFIEQTNKFIENPRAQQGRGLPSFLGIESLQTTKTGEILSSQIRHLTIKNISEILDEENLKEFSKNKNSIIREDDYIIRRYISGNTITYFFFPERDDINILKRDILRFLVLDLFLLIPIWLLMKMQVRNILRPVRENLDTMTHFVHDAGHELKTPIAIISGNLQIMRDSNNPEYDLIEGSLETIDAMNESIQGLLELADLKLPEDETTTNLQDIIEQEIKRANNFRNVTFDNQITKKFIVNASEKHLSILARNLIENAIKYNKTDGLVTIKIHKNSLIIEDTGIGMSEEDSRRVFDRFYRANQGSGVNGSGIGLTLVDSVIKLYGWKINVQSELDKGTIFTVTF